jgi:excinuclease ABC subunit C
LRGVAARIRYRVTGSKLEQTFTLYQQARAYFPQRYRDLVRLRPPAFLKVNLRSEYPRCYVTRRIRGDRSFYFGPFASRRMAEAFSESFLDLFKIRRCQIKIRRDPDFPGCIYSEMKMCLAPCFAGCTKQEYDDEVGRVLETLETTGEALTGKFTREREAASEALDFERAAGLHKRLEKVSGTLRGLPEIARRVEKLNAVILQRAAGDKTILAFPVLRGSFAEPIFLRFGEISSDPRSVEAILRGGLGTDVPPAFASDADRKDAHVDDGTAVASNSIQGESGPAAATPPAAGDRALYGMPSASPELPEHLALLSRWFYSNPREGEIFFKEGDWPYRRILRSCARLLAPATQISESRPVSPSPPNE